MTNFVLPLDAFIRAVGASRNVPHALFLGAGASITSGMPSAQMCIWEWKRNIFLTNNLGLEPQFAELSLVSVRDRIQRWLNRQGIYPPNGAPEEYSVYIEACFPIAESRRSFFQEKVRASVPHIGYKLLALLASKSLIKSIWTTNFDQLASRSASASNVVPVEIGLDSAHRIVRPTRAGELLIVSLHGDYRYDHLKNTSEEIKRQEQDLELALIEVVRSSPVIISGYSGRDESIMVALCCALEQKGSSPLFWCVQDSDNVPKSVLDLISNARACGREAYIIPTQGFDDVMIRLALHCLDGDTQAQATRLIAQNSGSLGTSRPAFRITTSTPITVLKSNAFEIECPSEPIAFELKNWPKEKVWTWVREQTAEKTVTAVPFKGKIFALGTIEDVRACFGNNIKDIPRPTPLPEGSLRFEDGAITCLMREALVHSIVLATGLRSDGSRELWAEDTVHDESLEGELFRIFESVHLTLRQIDGRSFLILKPSIKVLTISGDTVPTLKSNALKLRILGWQHNKEFNQAVNFWRKRLLTTDRSERIYEYPFKSGAPFRFSIRRSPAFAEITSDRGARGINVDTKIRPLLIQKGLQIDEPRLVFCNRSGTGNVKNVHPVRGLLSNRPFDFPLTMRGLSSEIRMGVVCPKAEAKALQSYLMRSEQQIEPNRQELDYLPSYPGFKNAFGLELKIGDQGNAGWVICPEPNGQNDQANALEIGKNINRSIDTLQASFAPNLVLIFFPERWSRFRGYNTDHEHFDVHDFVKASSVQKGIGTQFLDQSTLADGLQCRVWWWLSLAFYVKAMRTPWVLDELDRNTAFVGLGMSYDFSRDKNKHIVLGCSHIYSSRGEGLQYRLSPVENPVFFGKNPFLSRDDARRVGEQVRELFFESRSTLPDRVVVHKRTRFTKDEQQGLREGLSGVSEIDMLEIIIDDALRYVASAADARGLLHEDNYPVQRGSVVRLDDFTALLWVHGATSAIGNRRYYQGKRRIPAPLRIRRHAGQSDVKILAEEILGLSKMNWNTFDLYTKLPTTVQSSNEIARIGSLLTPFHPRGYDFRLFI